MKGIGFQHGQGKQTSILWICKMKLLLWRSGVFASLGYSYIILSWERESKREGRENLRICRFINQHKMNIEYLKIWSIKSLIPVNNSVSLLPLKAFQTCFYSFFWPRCIQSINILVNTTYIELSKMHFFSKVWCIIP